MSRDTYLARLPAEDVEFLYAIHVGETISEDHVFNLVRFNATGGGLLIDTAKGFMRELEPEEVAAYQTLPHVETGPLLAEDLRHSMEWLNGPGLPDEQVGDRRRTGRPGRSPGRPARRAQA